MAADALSERFEDIDWDSVRGGGLLTGSQKYLYSLVALGLVSLLFLYDYFLVGSREPTVPLVNWYFTQVDWMFVLTLVAMVFYVVMPLYQNPRMTRYYWKEFKKNTAAVISLAFLVVVFLIGVIGPYFLEPPTVQLSHQFQPPVFFTVADHYPLQCLGERAGGRCYGTWQHPFGTTRRGKDILTIVVYGMQISMKIALITGLFIIIIGSAVGTTAAYVGGLVDEILMRYVDIQLVFPSFLLYLLLLYLFGASLLMFILVFGLTSWGGIARLVRSESLQRREEEYITAAESAGASTYYVIWRHIVPNVSNTVITATTLLLPGLLLFEAGLAFIGLGDPTLPSWGQIIAQGRDNLTFAWWISTIPGFFLFLTILAFNFLGDALRDALDPRAAQE